MRHLINILCILLTTGCAYYSPYQKPNVPVTNQWTVLDRNLNQINENNLPYLAWWQGYHDSTLNQLIAAAIQNNNTLNMSKGHIEAAEGELKKVRLQWIPDVDSMVGYSKNPATGFPGSVAAFIPNYTLNLFGQIKEQKKAKYALAAVKAEDDAIKLTIISQMAVSYFTYQAEIERKQLLQILAQDLTHLATIATNVYHGGLTSDIDPQALYSQVNQIHGEQEVIERNIVVSRNAIRYLMNQNPGEIHARKKFTELNNKQLIPGALPLTVLENRPDMQMATNRLHASNEGIGLAASKLLPSIDLDIVSGVKAGDNRYNFPTENVFFNDQLLKTPLLKLSVLGDIAKARGLDKVSFFNYIDTLQKALRDATNALAANERLTNKFNQTQLAQKHLAKAYHLNHCLYQRGIQSYVDTLKSKIALDKINIDLNQDKLQQLITVVNLYQELAGGYKAEQPSSAA
ncbi:TolC family protein [Legionella oakridgensis]|uniref:Outer membrane protein n=2 Tax=Legionella oakridgensis TaxID=29423 RepID=W0BC41_9GAMM|nr:TolC family protein [Legionella oakridgensis]AHE66241.1 outer membrane protein [Legionella oakridgensis ATCC 33761 = DSM 21215]ETO93957.1 outer membrane protein [Legionella oakridgensis RV-2-2007]KTD44764.1 outer membrane efflux protein [Legionella oakridgensis]STY16142.1 outer membrane efflux protein [Legionella longbeachae]